MFSIGQEVMVKVAPGHNDPPVGTVGTVVAREADSYLVEFPIWNKGHNGASARLKPERSGGHCWWIVKEHLEMSGAWDRGFGNDILAADGTDIATVARFDEANARLIAAAPELLAVLRSIVIAEDYDDIEMVRSAARAAIAKAEDPK